MAPIGTTAVITAQPGSGDAVEAILATLATATHQEPGCLLYSLQRGLEERDVFVTVEKWESAEALQQHLGSAHIAEALSQSGHLLAEPPRIIATQGVGAGDAAKNTY